MTECEGPYISRWMHDYFMALCMSKFLYVSWIMVYSIGKQSFLIRFFGGHTMAWVFYVNNCMYQVNISHWCPVANNWNYRWAKGQVSGQKDHNGRKFRWSQNCLSVGGRK